MTASAGGCGEGMIMSLPGFTAPASLYQTNRQYQTGRGRHGVDVSAHANGSIYPALPREDAGVIEVYDCNPGFLKFGEGEDTVCVPFPSWVGGDEPGHGGDEGSGSGSGGEAGGFADVPEFGGHRLKGPKGSHMCGRKDHLPEASKACFTTEAMNDITHTTTLFCGPGKNVSCCTQDKNGKINCRDVSGQRHAGSVGETEVA
jgi:hypothetical protein